MNESCRPAETLIVPADLLLDGWVHRRGAILERRPHAVIRALPCGNYLVRNPARIVADEAGPANPVDAPPPPGVQ